MPYCECHPASTTVEYEAARKAAEKAEPDLSSRYLCFADEENA